jgi:hypothetical protein
VLARLRSEPGIDSVEVDRRGELLRIRAGSAAHVRAVVDRLYEMGFAGEPAADGEAIEQRWYGPDDVGELSREEAYVIAYRVVPAFTQGAPTGIDVSALVTLVAAALHQCFVTSTLDASDTHGALNSACAGAVEAATRGHIGDDQAAALGRAIETDLATRSAFRD